MDAYNDDNVNDEGVNEALNAVGKMGPFSTKRCPSHESNPGSSNCQSNALPIDLYGTLCRLYRKDRSS